MSFEQLVEGMPWYLVLGTVMLVVTILLALVYRPTPSRLSPPTRGPGPAPPIRRTDQDAVHEEDVPPFLGEKRGSLRRTGNPVAVLLANDIEGSRPFPGAVLDRSTTGLRLSVATEVKPGCVLRVRAEHAPDTTPWVYIQVCHCKKSGRGRWEIGCRFSQTPPWSILLLFG